MGFWKRLGRVFGEGPEHPEQPAGTTPLEQTPEAHFASMFAEEALDHPLVERVEPNPEAEFSLCVWVKDSEHPSVVYLGNLFREARELIPEEKREHVRRTIDALVQRDEELDWDDAAEVLVPLVRMASFAIDAPIAPLFRPFLPFVRLFVGVDRGASVAYVNREHVERWAREEATVFSTALEVLGHHVEAADIESYDPEAEYAIWHVTREDSYEASRLALPRFLASFRARVEGNPIAIIPDRSKLLIAGDANPAAIARLARAAEAEFVAAVRPISPAVYTVDENGEVVPLHLPASHPHHYLVERGHRLLASSCYADQKAFLEKVFEASGEDVFVATLGVFSVDETGETRTWASMAEGVDTLLPEVDVLALAEDRKQGWRAWVPWEKVFELAPECFEKDPNQDPPRWRTVGWPSPDVVEKLRAAALF